MKKGLFSIFLTLLLISTYFLSNTFALNYIMAGLPEGSKMRLGKGGVSEIAYSPDGTKIAVATTLGIWIYDAKTSEELNLFTGGRSPIDTVAFSPDGKMLASDIDGENLCLWDADTGAQLRTFKSNYNISTIVFSPDGRLIASGGFGYIGLWDIKTGRRLFAFRVSASSVTSVAFSPDGKTIAFSAAYYKSFYLLDVNTGEQLSTFAGHTEGVSSVAFSPDGQLIASGSYDNTVRLWDLETGVQQHSLTKHTDSVYAVAFSPDGKTLASGSRDNTIRLWNVSNLLTRHVLIGHTSSIWTIAFSQDSLTLVSRSNDGTLRLWDVDSGKEQRTITGHGHTQRVVSIAYSPDGNKLVSGSWDKVVRLWNLGTGTVQNSFIGHTSYVNSVAFSPDGKTIASGSNDGTLRMWDADTGIERHTLIDTSGDVENVAFRVVGVMFSPDGKKVACAITTSDYSPPTRLSSSDIHLFDVETGSVLHTIAAYKKAPPTPYGNEPEFHPTEHTAPVTNITFSPDSKVLASSSDDHTVRFWDVQTGTHLRVLTEEAGIAYSLAFNPDGNILACSRSTKIIDLWDVPSGTQLLTLTGHTEGVYSVAFSPDGSLLASGSFDNTVRLWDVDSGMMLHPFIGHKGLVYSVAFSPDGNTLASGSSDGTVLLWDIISPVPPNTTVSLSPISVESPVVGEQLTLSINIADGQIVTGYQATVHFDATVLRFVESSIGNYLPAPAYVIEPVVDEGIVMLAATSFAEESHNDGTLATITFEVIATKVSTVSLTDVLLTDSIGNSTAPRITASTEITEPMFPPEDVNEDGVVNILDLNFIAAHFGKTGKNNADVNNDGIVNIVDLTIVAAAIANANAAAPALWRINEKDMPTRAMLEAWLKEARQLNLADPGFQRGILILEQLLAALTPKETALLPNYPNPFNPETWIPYQLATPADVRISIYAADGKLIRTLDLGHQPVGIYHHRNRAVHWDGKNAQGEPVASGIYFYTLKAGDFTATRKMLIRK